jgi:hypothetical protein
MRQKKNNSNTKKNRRSRKFSYDVLEDRRVLTTFTGFDAAGVVTIGLSDNNDVAVVDVATNGNLTVNGSQDINSSAAGVQTLTAAAVSQFVVNGDATKSSQAAAFGGAFTGARSVESITVNDVNLVSFNGQYNITQNLTIGLVGADGRVGDSTAGRLTVGGLTDITARNNAIGLNNVSNDFNQVSLSTAGVSQNAVITDINGMEFVNIRTTGDLIATAGGAITDAAGAVVEVDGDGWFVADSVVLGDNASDVTNFFRSGFDVSGHVELNEDTNTIFLTSNMGSLTVDSAGGVFDGRTTTVIVQGLADITAANRIRLGNHGTDTFNAGSIQFNTNGHAHFFEDSGTVIVGTNTANSLDITSLGDVRDAEGTSINVNRQTGLEGDNIVLGNAPSDVFNSGSLYFFTLGDYFVTEDSDSHIIETKNRAGQFSLTSAGAITDADNARVAVDNLAKFDAVSVNMGDKQTDLFNAGSVQFRTTGRFKLSENSALNIEGANTAGNSVINANGDITDDANATVNVINSAAFFGHNIKLGDATTDVFNAGSLTFATATSETGIVEITENSATQIGGNNNASVLRLNSGGAITDGPFSNVDVTGNTRLTTANNGGITLGDSGTDAAGNTYDATFNTGSLTVVTNGTGNAIIEEDSAIFLTGATRANSLTLVADGGLANVTDSATAQTSVIRNLNVTGDFINLGTGVDTSGATTDSLTMASLTFNSLSNTNIEADSSFVLTGSSYSDDFLTLRSTGNILSTAGSETVALTGALFDAVDVMIGNLADDCFDIINSNADGSKNLTVNAANNSDVQFGGC